MTTYCNINSLDPTLRSPRVSGVCSRVMKLLLPLAIGAAGALAGCQTTSSADVDTSGIWADFWIQAPGDGRATVYATLRVGGATSNTYVELQAGESLTVAAAGQSQTLQANRSVILDAISYSSKLATDAEGTEVEIALHRTKDAGAPRSVVTLPKPLEVTAPAAGASVSKAGDGLTITWAPSGGPDPVTVSVTGGCIEAYEATPAGDPGTFTLAPGALAKTPEGAADHCEGTVSVTRKRAGTLDPAYKGGRIDARQVRQVKVQLVP